MADYSEFAPENTTQEVLTAQSAAGVSVSEDTSPYAVDDEVQITDPALVQSNPICVLKVDTRTCQVVWVS